MTAWLLYGAYGYTGKLIVAEAVQRGHRPTLAGRNAAKLAPLAETYGLEWQALDLNDAALDGLVARHDLVLHAAGPFTLTAAPMLRACLAGKTHYLDITGEISVLEQTLALDEAARTQGIAFISGAGFDVIPTDCLALYVAGQAPGATELEIAFASLGKASAGTVKSVLEMLARGGLVRRDGYLIHYPFGRGARQVTFSNGKTYTVLPIPWGDLATAPKTTGIANVTTYMARRVSPGLRRFGPVAERLMAIRPLRRLVQKAVEKTVTGPDEETRRRGRSYIWAHAANGAGDAAEAWLETLEGYSFTAVAAVRCVEKTLAQPSRGALTPALAFGADFVLEIEGTRRFDALPA